MKPRGLFLAGLFAVFGLSALAAPARGQSFNDQTFNNADWVSAIAISTQGGTTSSTQMSSPGAPSPPSYRETQHTNYDGTFAVTHLKNGATYNPATQGKITSIDFKLAIRHFTEANFAKGAEAVAYYLLLVQGGTRYYAAQALNYEDLWKSFTQQNLTSTSFTKLKADDPGPANPDFSCGGGEIQFGYLTYNLTRGAKSKTMGIDDWEVALKTEKCGDQTNTGGGEGTGCLKPTAETKCNPDGSVTLTLTTAPPTGFASTTITLASQTPGVTVQPAQQTLAPNQTQTTWTLVGATAGQTVTLAVNETKPGGGTGPGTDLCCSGEIKVMIPECRKPIDVAIQKENTPSGGTGTWFNITVGNVGAPITFQAGEFTVTDVIPAGMTVTSVTANNWTCGPTPPLNPGSTLTCTYNLAGSLGQPQAIPDSIYAYYTTAGPGPFVNCAVVAVPATIGVDSNLPNNTSCVTVTPTLPGALIVVKKVTDKTPAAHPSLQFPVTVICGAPANSSTNLTLVHNVPQTVSNIPAGSTCTVNEPMATLPTVSAHCGQGKVAAWDAPTYSPPSVVIAAATPQTITVDNVLSCKTRVDVSLAKTGSTSANQCVDGWQFTLSPKNESASTVFAGQNVIVVTDTVPADLQFASVTAVDWTCTPIPASAGQQMTCIYAGTGPTALSQALGSIVISAKSTKPPPYKDDVTNCADLAILPASTLVDNNLANNTNKCITLKKTAVCTQECPSPTVSGSAPGTCVCPPGTTQAGKECVRRETCPPPLVPGAAAGSCVCPPGTVSRGRRCLPPIECRRPTVANEAGTACVCPPGMRQRGGRCVPPLECRPPAIANAAGTACVCPPGTIARGRACVRPPECRPPMVQGPAPGVCVCPPGMQQRGRACVPRSDCRPPMLQGPVPGMCVCPPGTQQRGRECVRARDQEGPGRPGGPGRPSDAGGPGRAGGAGGSGGPGSPFGFPGR